MRVIDIPSATTLDELHNLLQAAIGWTDSHLHRFETSDAVYGMGDEDAPTDELLETGVRLDQVGPRFAYFYDFGDGWVHDVEIIGSGDEVPGCRYGEGACPPEDCGGPGGYEHLRRVLADPSDPEHEQLRAWAGDLADFDQEATDAVVRRMVGEVPPTVRLVLDLLAGGVKLTPAGRLPRVLVRRVQEVHPQWHPLERPASTEDNLPPLAVLHDLLRDVGLVRVRGGVLTPTKAAGDDLQTVRRLRSWFGASEFHRMLADRAVAIVAACGERDEDALATDVRRMLGHGWETNGRMLTDTDVRWALVDLSNVLRALDLIVDDGYRSTWRAGPSAESLLPGATLLAPYLRKDRLNT